MTRTIGIIGGGIAGVGAAWSLHRAGYQVELFEKGPAQVEVDRWISIEGDKVSFVSSLIDGQIDLR